MISILPKSGCPVTGQSEVNSSNKNGMLHFCPGYGFVIFSKIPESFEVAISVGCPDCVILFKITKSQYLKFHYHSRSDSRIDNLVFYDFSIKSVFNRFIICT